MISSIVKRPPSEAGFSRLAVVACVALLLFIIAGGVILTTHSSTQARVHDLTSRVAALEQKAGDSGLSPSDQHTLHDLAQTADILSKTAHLPDNTKTELTTLAGRIQTLETTAAVGATGLAGTDGAKGDTGNTGATGATGPQGPSGTATCDYGVCLSLQNSSPGTQETGSINISDDAIIGGSVSAAVFSGNGSALSSLNASQVASGTLSDSRLSSNVTIQGNSFNGTSQLVQTTAGGLLPALSGANLTNIDATTLQGNASSYFTNATNLSSGTLSDSRLSSNVALLNAANTFTNTMLLSAAGTALTVTNNASIGGTLNVTGLATLGSLSVTGNASVTGSLSYGTTLSSNCAGLTGYVWVPGSAKFGTLPGFCVMKYDASDDGSGNPVSVAGATPWVSISQRTAQDKAIATCAGCHLLSEAEWMTIATNALWQNANWCSSDGSACNNAPGTASKYLAAGHNDNSPAQALAASSDDNQACYGTVTAGVNTVCGSAGTQKRTLTLSNGNVIWDIGGNVWNWTDAWSLGSEGPTIVGSEGFTWREFTAITKWGALAYAMPTNRGWNSSQHLGQIYSDGTSSNSTQYAFLRGGYWLSGSAAGAFTLALDIAPTSTHPAFGFRVAR